MKLFYFVETLKRYWLNLLSAAICATSGTIGIVDIVQECIQKDTPSIIYDVFWITVTFGLAFANVFVFKKSYNRIKRVLSN